MRFGSVCSGIEAASVAFAPLGWEAAWLAETDLAASAVLSHRYGATAPRFPVSEKDAKRAAKIEWGDRVTNWGDMTRIPDLVRSGEAEAPDVLCGGTPCFPAGALVSTPKGFKEIQTIRPGDIVLTHEGRYRKVLRTGSKFATNTVCITGQGHHGLNSTSNHPFLTRQRTFSSTRKNGKAVALTGVTHLQWTDAADLKGHHWAALERYPEHPIMSPEAVGRETPVPGMCEALAWLAGAYVGDGWTRINDRRGYVLYGVNDSKAELIRKTLSDYGLTHSESRERTTLRIQISSRPLARWMVTNFGSGSEGKELPTWLFGADEGIRRAFFEGYAAMDGTKIRLGHRIVTVSRKLALGTKILANTLGMAASVRLVEPTRNKCFIEGREVREKAYYTVSTSTSSRTSFSDGKYRFGCVRSVTPSKPCMVYNLEVEEDHTYLVDGIVVHNCQSYSIAGRRKGLGDERGQLTLKFVEIADEIDNARARLGLQPCIVFWENVPGVLTDAGNAFGNYLADLAGDDQALEPGPRPEHGRSSTHWSWKKDAGEHRPKWSNAGIIVGPKRTVAWRVMDAQYFGLAQRRARLFVVASAGMGIHPDEILLEFDRMRRDTQPRRPTGEDLARSAVERAFESGDWHRGLHPSLAQSHSTGGIGQSNQELFSQRGAGLVAVPGADMGHGGIEPDVFRLVAFGDYRHDSKSSSLNARDHKYVTDIVLHHGQPVTSPGDVLAFDTTQITSPANFSRPQPGDPCHPLAAGAHAPAICFTSKDHGQDATEEMAPTMRAMSHGASHANGGGQLAVAFTERGRPEGRTVEVNGDLAYALLAPTGGSRSQEKMVATKGAPNADAHETDTAQILRELRECVGEEAFARWGTGIVASLFSPEVLQSWLHGKKFLTTPKDGRPFLDDCALPRAQDLPGGVLQNLWLDGPHGCSSQGRRLAEQLTKQFGETLQIMPQQAASVGFDLHYMPEKGEGPRVLPEALAEVQEMGRPEADNAKRITTSVRRLIPVETERLQGFPDGYTLVPVAGKLAADGPRYKQLGNSWPVAVVNWIGQRIDRAVNNSQETFTLSPEDYAWLTAP